MSFGKKITDSNSRKSFYKIQNFNCKAAIYLSDIRDIIESVHTKYIAIEPNFLKIYGILLGELVKIRIKLNKIFKENS